MVRHRQPERQRLPRLRRVENAVVPQARRRVVRRALVIVLLEDRLPHRLLVFGGERLAFARKLVALDGRQHARGLLATHHRDAGVRPHPQEARLVRAAAHSVVAGPERPADDDGELGHHRVGNRMHHLGPVLRDAGALVLASHDEAGDVLQKHERNPAHVAQLDEVRRFQRRLREQHTVVPDDADEQSVQPCEAGHERGPVPLLEFVESRAVHEPCDDLPDIVRPAHVGADDAVDLGRVVAGLLRRRHVGRQPLDARQRRDDRAADREGILIVLGEVVGDARDARVDVGPAELLGRHLLSRGSLHERRAAEKDRAGSPDDDGLVGHGGNVGAAGRARPHDDRNLRDALRRHARLVEEDTSEMLAIRKDLRLKRQERAAGIDEVDARQAVVERDLLRPHMFLDGDRVVRATLDGRIVRDDEHLAAGDAPDAGDDACVGSPGTELEFAL